MSTAAWIAPRARAVPRTICDHSSPRKATVMQASFHRPHASEEDLDRSAEKTPMTQSRPVQRPGSRTGQVTDLLRDMGFRGMLDKRVIEVDDDSPPDQASASIASSASGAPRPAKRCRVDEPAIPVAPVVALVHSASICSEPTFGVPEALSPVDAALISETRHPEAAAPACSAVFAAAPSALPASTVPALATGEAAPAAYGGNASAGEQRPLGSGFRVPEQLQHLLPAFVQEVDMESCPASSWDVL